MSTIVITTSSASIQLQVKYYQNVICLAIHKLPSSTLKKYMPLLLKPLLFTKLVMLDSLHIVYSLKPGIPVELSQRCLNACTFSVRNLSLDKYSTISNEALKRLKQRGGSFQWVTCIVKRRIFALKMKQLCATPFIK